MIHIPMMFGPVFVSIAVRYSEWTANGRLIVTKQSVQAQHEYHIIIWLQKLQRVSSCMSQIITSQIG